MTAVTSAADDPKPVLGAFESGKLKLWKRVVATAPAPDISAGVE